MIEGYIIHILTFICIQLISAMALNLSLGYTGLLNLGHVGLLGVGAYATAILFKIGLPFLPALLVAALLTAACSFGLVYVTRKLKDIYLALATLGFSFLASSLFLNLETITGGAVGLPGIPRPSIFGVSLLNNGLYLILVIVFTIVCLFALYRVINSRFGRLLQATRDDEQGLRVLGRNTFKLKSYAMIISGFFVGIAGGLLGVYLSYLNPVNFSLIEIIAVFTIVIVGGLASFRGTILGTFVVILLPEAVRFLSINPVHVGPFRQIVYALILILILLYKPRGFLGRIDLA
jgi:branched-chain amino acid transport system permease protein